MNYLVTMNNHKTYSSYFASKRKQRGATLIESMVALVVFSIGALGIAALQTTSLVRSDDTKQRSLAIWKGQELVDRIRSTKTIADPNGLIEEYVDAIDVQTTDAIGSFANTGGFSCPVAPTRCDDQSGTAANDCSEAQLVAFDVWSIICDPITGASVPAGGVDDDGAVKLKNLDIALVPVDIDNDGDGSTDRQEFNLYLEWLSRGSEQNEDVQAAPGATRTVATELCGSDLNVDTRLGVYCLRFQ